MKQLLIETMPVAFEILEQASSKNGGRIKVRGIFGVADEPTANDRVYPESVMDREIAKLNILIEDRRGWAEADHPGDGKSTIKNTAAWFTKKIEKQVVNDRKVYMGEAIILRTEPGGKNLQEMIEVGGKVEVSQRGFGDTKRGKWQGKDEDIVQEDYSLKTYDFVIGGATKDATISQVMEQTEVINLIEAGPCEGCQNLQNQTKTEKGGTTVMEIKTLEELKKSYPELCTQLEEQAMAKKEKELKVAMKEEWDKGVKEIADGIKKSIEESKEYKLYKEGMDGHKSVLVEIGKLVKSYISDAVSDEDKTEKRLAEVETRLKVVTEENKALKEQKEKDKTEAENKEKVQKRIGEVTTGKEHEKMLVERLQDCKTAEEVDTRLAKEEAFIKTLLAEGKPGDKPTGDGKVLNEDEEDKKRAAQLNESQQRDRRIAGLA